MPIYEYYCEENNTIYQFYAKSVAQGQTTPRCPDNPKFRLKKRISGFVIGSGGKSEGEGASGEAPGAPGANLAGGGGMGMNSPEDARLDAAMGEMEREFSALDEKDPKAMGRIMRRMAEVTGEKLEGEAEEVVRKLEEGADPDSLEDQFGVPEGQAEDSGDPFGGGIGADPDMPPAKGPADPKEPKHRFKARRPAARRDPKLYDYE